MYTVEKKMRGHAKTFASLSRRPVFLFDVADLYDAKRWCDTCIYTPHAAGHAKRSYEHGGRR
jgi:hypothetical protein